MKDNNKFRSKTQYIDFKALTWLHANDASGLILLEAPATLDFVAGIQLLSAEKLLQAVCEINALVPNADVFILVCLPKMGDHRLDIDVNKEVHLQD